MRERLAEWVAGLSLAVVVLLAFLFARYQNPQVRPAVDAGAEVESAQPPAAPEPLAARGFEVFEQEGCARCHSIGGIGNPRSPLDDVGARRAPDSIRSWILGTGSAHDSLSAAVLRRKSRYSELAPDALDALTRFLAGLAGT